MADSPVAFIDSGIGGLPYVAYTRSMAPQERYVHVADRGNFPYGSKSEGEIISSTISLTERLLARENPRLIVVACNTMSVVALAALRARFPLPFVGVVPAIKPAAAYSKKKRICILGTPRTVEGSYLRGLVEKYADGCSVSGVAAQDLVSYIEKELYRDTPEARKSRARVEADRVMALDVDAVVLACTHFLHLAEEFKQVLGPGVAVVDSREGVAKQVLRILGYPEKRPTAAPPRADSLYVTGEPPVEARYAHFASAFGLAPEGIL
jgi:glutamate racemase